MVSGRFNQGLVLDPPANTKDDADNLFFLVATSATTAHFRYIRMNGALFMLAIEYPQCVSRRGGGKEG
jgi:hypothetical protein